ncbi:MAG TPA: hypothetical protein DEA08_27145, partial [Planctomycetes bacterium]|nr:hypothetical protein [Planctomycetota bacterium]
PQPAPQPAPQPEPTPRATPEPLPPLEAAPEIRGVAFPLHSRDPRYDYRPSLAELPEHGIQQVLVVVHLFQPRGVSPFPARHPLKTPRDEVVRTVITAARELGLEVGLMPIVLLETPHKGEWRGNLTPPDKQGRTRGQAGFDGRQADWARWFRGYRREVLHYARLAQRAGASLFSVGSELSSTEAQAEHWTALIREVRGLFAGELTYSANWDHYENVQVWQQLDYVGLSGYYELVSRQNKTPTLRELIAGWGRWRDKILAWHRRAGLSDHPLLFTEVGYASIDGCAAKPWDYTLDTRLDLSEQRDCYRAFAHAWGGQEALGGVFFYEWWGHGGRADRGYTPRGKPAMSVIREWFRVGSGR